MLFSYAVDSPCWGPKLRFMRQTPDSESGSLEPPGSGCNSGWKTLGTQNTLSGLVLSVDHKVPLSSQPLNVSTRTDHRIDLLDRHVLDLFSVHYQEHKNKIPISRFERLTSSLLVTRSTN